MASNLSKRLDNRETGCCVECNRFGRLRLVPIDGSENTVDALFDFGHSLRLLKVIITAAQSQQPVPGPWPSRQSMG